MNPTDDDARLHWTFEKLLIAAAGCGLFIGAATFLGPQSSEAGQPLPPRAAHALGVLIGPKYHVRVSASPQGPLYTVCTPTGQPLASPLPADAVYRTFPDLDIQSMTSGPDAGTPLMMADDHGG